MDKEEAIALSPSPIYYIAKENLFLSLEHVWRHQVLRRFKDRFVIIKLITKFMYSVRVYPWLWGLKNESERILYTDYTK